MANSTVSASLVYTATVATSNSTVSANTVYVATVATSNSTISAAFIYVATIVQAAAVPPSGGGVSVPGTRAANTTQSQGAIPGTRAANTTSSSRSSGGGGQSRSAQTPRFNPVSILDAMDGTVGYVQWRAYIGPPFRKSTDNDFYDWSALTLAAYTPSPADTTLSSGVSAVATVANLTSAASFPSAGGLWLGPNAVGESWGYATYTGKSVNQLTGLTRDTVDAEYTGVHTAAAVARFWWELDTATAEPVLRETMDASYSAVGWEGTIGGIVAPVPAMRASHLFLMQIRELSGGAWGSWTNWLIGWTLGSGVQDNADKERPWTLQVAGLNGILSQREVTGLRVGPPDIADNADITVSSTLSPAYKEANTGEFTGSNPNIGSGALVDNDTATPWISGGFVGENNIQIVTADVVAENLYGIKDRIGIVQFHINPYPGQSNGYRWLEILLLMDHAGGQTDIIVNIQFYVDIGSSLEYDAGTRLILAENPTLFAEENPENQATVLDLANYQLWDAGRARYVVTTGGATGGTFTLTVDSQITTAIAYNATAAQVETAIEALSTVGLHNVRVTTGSQWNITYLVHATTGVDAGITGSGAGLTGGSFSIVTTATQDPFYTGNSASTLFDYLESEGGMIRITQGPPIGSDDTQAIVVYGDYVPLTGGDYAPSGVAYWTGVAMTAPTAGQTASMVFFPTTPTTSAEYWRIGKIATPGYTVITTTKEWIYFNLPTMGLSLSADIDNAVTSIVIAKEGEANVNGLPATGTIQIGIEQITYTTINRTTGTISGGARGANSTTAISHLAGDTVYFVASGVATEGYSIDTIEIVRPTGFSVPKNFIIWGSELATARLPDDAFFTDDYSELANVTNNVATTYSLDLSATAPRIRYLLVEITAMSVSPSRAKVNELRVLIDGDVLDSSQYLASGTVATAIDTLLLAAGIPAAATTDGGGTQTVDEYTTQTDLLWPVLVDLAEFTNTRITVGRDSKVTFESDPFWGISGTPAEASELTRTNAAHVEINKTPVRTIGQVELTWRPPSSETEDIATFPATYTTGRKAKIGPYVYADATAALAGATKRYYQMRRPYDAVVELATQGDSIRAGTIRGLNWILHDSQLAQDRTYLCIQSAHTIRNFGWNSVLTLLQLNRTDEL